MRKIRHHKSAKHAFKRFISYNKVIISLSFIILLGVIVGSCIFPILSEEYRRFLSSVYQSATVPTSFLSGCTYACSVAFRSLILLAALFLCGLTAFGWPLILLVLMLFGVQIGVTDCCVFIDGGWFALMVTEILPLIFVFIGILHAAQSSLHMSTALAKQLLPSAAHCGSIWHDFKRYLAANGISILWITAASVIKTIIIIYR